MITLCENCDERIWLDAGTYRHRDEPGQPVTCARGKLGAAGNAPRAELGAEAWETEDGETVIVAARSTAHAAIVIEKLYLEILGELDDVDPEAMAENAMGQWVNRSHPDYDAEVWPDGVTSRTERPGDVEMLVYS